MRAVLEALTDELKRLKTAGVKTVPVSDESLEALRRLAAAEGPKFEAGGRKPEASNAGDRRPETGKDDQTTVAAAPRTPASRLQTPDSVRSGLPPPPVVEIPPGDKQTRWQALRELVLNHPVCRANVRPGKKVVFGVGSLDTRIMFIGEAPGADEEVQGEPFVGPAGQLLTKMIKGMGLERGDVYIGNIMNWRPQLPPRAGGVQVGNRPPTPEEMAFCLPFLRAQIEIVDPQIVVALGVTAAKGLLGPEAVPAMGAVRGRWHAFGGKPMRVTYHPSYLLHNNSNRAKRLVWEDLLAVMERAGLPISDKQRGFFL